MFRTFWAGRWTSHFEVVVFFWLSIFNFSIWERGDCFWFLVSIRICNWIWWFWQLSKIKYQFAAHVCYRPGITELSSTVTQTMVPNRKRFFFKSWNGLWAVQHAFVLFKCESWLRNSKYIKNLFISSFHSGGQTLKQF